MFGQSSKAFDFMPNTGELDLWDSGSIGLEADIAIDGNGSTFATTSGGGVQVDVYQRAAAGARFSKIATLESQEMRGAVRQRSHSLWPSTAVPQCAHFSQLCGQTRMENDDCQRLYSVARFRNQTVVSERSCPSTSPGFNYVMQPGLAISRGEAVAVGSWGCGAGAVGGETILLKVEAEMGKRRM